MALMLPQQDSTRQSLPYAWIWSRLNSARSLVVVSTIAWLAVSTSTALTLHGVRVTEQASRMDSILPVLQHSR